MGRAMGHFLSFCGLLPSPGPEFWLLAVPLPTLWAVMGWSAGVHGRVGWSKQIKEHRNFFSVAIPTRIKSSKTE